MKLRWIGALLVVGSVGTGCGDDDDDGGGGGADGCAHVQEVCESNASVDIDCDDWDKAPESARSCASKAADCDAVLACLLAAAGS